jgi:hypothetical protein
MHNRELQVDDLVLEWVLTQEGANKLSTTLPGNPSPPPQMRPPGYGGWRPTTKPLEHITPT